MHDMLADWWHAHALELVIWGGVISLLGLFAIGYGIIRILQWLNSDTRRDREL